MKKKNCLRICLALMTVTAAAVAVYVVLELTVFKVAPAQQEYVWAGGGTERTAAQRQEAAKNRKPLPQKETPPQKETSQNGPSEIEPSEKEPTPNKTDSDKTVEETGQPQEEDTVTLLFAGDTFYEGSRGRNYQEHGVDGIISEELKEQLLAADISVMNLECALSDRGTPVEGKEYVYRMPPAYVNSFLDLGVDLLTMANNHTLDYGRDALSDTFETLEQAGVRYMGAGKDLERAREAQIFTVSGMKIAFLAASRVLPATDWYASDSLSGLFSTYDTAALEQEITKAKQEADFVVVYVHWGVMYEEYPEDYQRKMAENYVRAGADLVLGCHPHVLQGIEMVEGKPVYYSIGNFLYGSNDDRVMLLRAELSQDGSISTSVIPCRSSAGKTELSDEKNGAAILEYLEKISNGVRIDQNGNVWDAN